MNSLILAVVVGFAYIIAYRTYGTFLSKRIFAINPKNSVPSHTKRDGIDFEPTDKHVLFGHHFTSIAGLGPIVGPAVAIIWGWVPAVLWVLFGSILMGAVHDFGSLVMSLRNEGKSVGEMAGDIINPRVRGLFLTIIFFALWIVIAVFALIIALLFGMYPEAVIPVWFEIPLAIGVGYLMYKKGISHITLGIIGVVVMYGTVILGSYIPFEMPALFGFSGLTIWMVLLLVYAYGASTLPVTLLLQPRDYLNSHQLLIAMGLLVLGVVIAQPDIVAPALVTDPEGAPPLLPFLFVVLACGAVSGFHSLVSSGTSSKQCDNEGNAKFIGYGGMLVEGAMATLVIIAISAGLGMGLKGGDGVTLFGAEAFSHHYSSWAAAKGLSAKLGAFVTGSSNMIATLGIPVQITIAIMGVFLVSFAATTLDSATRIQRYVVTELADTMNFKPLKGKHPATAFAVITAFILAFSNGNGKGALALWPLFGSINQLLAGLALLVMTIYLVKRNVSAYYTAIPMVFMVTMTGWAMAYNLQSFWGSENWMLFIIGVAVFILEIWMIVETIIVFSNLKKNDSTSCDSNEVSVAEEEG
ncbi:MAG: carbon starvation protein A [Fibrobacterales bacterium]